MTAIDPGVLVSFPPLSRPRPVIVKSFLTMTAIACHPILFWECTTYLTLQELNGDFPLSTVNPKFRHRHSLPQRPSPPPPQEYLFSPYSVFTVERVDWRPNPGPAVSASKSLHPKSLVLKVGGVAGVFSFLF